MPAAVVDEIEAVPSTAAPTPAIVNGHKNGAAAAATKDSMASSTPAFDSIADVVKAFANDEFVIVLDSPNRENEGDLIIAAESITPAKAAFMIRYSSGYICAPLPASRAAALHLPQMVAENTDPNRTAYAVSVDGVAPGMTTGISATDRARTCNMLADAASRPTSFRRPGHILPLQAREGGVRVRRGHTEAAVDLCRLARKREVGVICELVTDGVAAADGTTAYEGAGMMRRDECLAFGKQWGIRVCTIEDLVTYVEEKEGKLGVAGVDY